MSKQGSGSFPECSEGEMATVTLSLSKNLNANNKLVAPSLTDKGYIETLRIPTWAKGSHHLYRRWISKKVMIEAGGETAKEALQLRVLDMEVTVAGRKSSLPKLQPLGQSPSLSIIFGLSSKTQWLSGLYYADFISFYSPTQLCGGGTTKSNSNELPISVPLSNCHEFFILSMPWSRKSLAIKDDIWMVQSGAEIHDYEPSTKEVAQIYDADVFVYHSQTLESWAGRLDLNLQGSKLQVIEGGGNDS